MLVRTFRPPSPRRWRDEVHPSVRFTSPTECCDFRPAPGLAAPTGLAANRYGARSASHGVMHPLRDVSRRRPHTPGDPSPDFGPSSAFRTPSTVYATTGLAGLFHPAADVQGFPFRGLSPAWSTNRFPSPTALVPLCDAPSGFDAGPDATPSTSGPCSPDGCGGDR